MKDRKRNPKMTTPFRTITSKNRRHSLLYKYLCPVICMMFVFLTMCTLTGCQKNTDPVTVTGFKLNTYVAISAYDSTDKALLQECLDLADHYEDMFSRTKETSLLSQINRQELHVIPEELAELIQYGIDYATLSNGSFDLTIGSVSSLWDFTSDDPQVPDQQEIASALSAVSYKNIELTPLNDGTGNYNISMPQGTMIDLGAIAKGYIADKMKEFLLSNNVKSAVINLGGNVLCVGNKPGNSAFHIGVKKPFTESGEVLATIKDTDKSIVSSGTYERCFTKDGQFYHHILTPATGYPYDNGLTSVTIISDASVTGDCLSTTCFTLGLDDGMKLIESTDGVEAIFVTSDGALHYSSGASQYLITE